MQSLSASVLLLAALIVAGALGGLLQKRVLDQHVDTVVIEAPRSTAPDGSLPAGVVEAFEARLAKCEASGARCTLRIDGPTVGAIYGWIPTPTPTR